MRLWLVDLGGEDEVFGNDGVLVQDDKMTRARGR